MRPTWLIEADVFGEESEPLKAEVRRRGMSCHVVRHPSISGTRRETTVGGQRLADDDCVVFYGSSPLMRHIQLHRSWVPGGWCHAANLACSTYSAHFGPHLLNRRYLLMPGVEAIHLSDWVFSVLARDGAVFVRPDGVGKLFAGRTTTREGFADALAPARYDPETLVVIAEPRSIAREWRLVVGGDEVVAASQYAVRGVRAFAPGCPAAVRGFAEGVLRDVRWRPDALFMMDVCESGGQYYVLELNSFSCSGLYRCDLAAVVATASDLATRAWDARGGSRDEPSPPTWATGRG